MKLEAVRKINTLRQSMDQRRNKKAITTILTPNENAVHQNLWIEAKYLLR